MSSDANSEPPGGTDVSEHLSGRDLTESVHIAIDGVTKIYGDSMDEALRLAQGGMHSDEIHEKCGSVVALNGVSFSIKRGEIFVVMGLSGSGKSTLVRCVNRLIDPTGGRVVVNGDDIASFDRARLQAYRRTQVSMVFQSYALLPHKTVYENVVFPLKIRGLSKSDYRAQADETIELVGLGRWGQRYPSELSGGMRQRVGLARALVSDPDILLMDEPFGALDPVLRRDMQDELLRLQEMFQKTIVFITHDLDEAVRLGDRIAILHSGMLSQVGEPEDIVLRPADDYVAKFVRDIDRSRVVRMGTVAQPGTPIQSARGQDRIAVDGMNPAGAFVLNAENRPVGFLSPLDAARALQDGQPLDSAMNRQIHAALASSSLRDNLAALSEHEAVAVVDPDGAYLGEVTGRQVMQMLAGGQRDGEPHDSE
ncbi:MAG: glycine betaine/L-proline ABC transporter ATP-binding protein [Acidimicrobiia bacterium]